MKKPLQWLICLLHFNELPFRHLFIHLDGTTSGPNAFKGPIGKQLKYSSDLEVTKFQKISCALPDISPFNILSTDQQYLYRMCLGISSGNIPSELSNMQPGKLCHARWLTTANSVLRIYVGSDNPTESLILLVRYILQVCIFLFMFLSIGIGFHN